MIYQDPIDYQLFFLNLLQSVNIGDIVAYSYTHRTYSLYIEPKKDLYTWLYALLRIGVETCIISTIK